MSRTRASEVTLDRAKFEHAIAILIGQPPALFALPEQPETRDTLPSLSTPVPASLLQRRPDIAAAERRVAAANAEIGAARAAFFPTIDLAAAIGQEGNGISHLLAAPATTWAIGPSALLAIFDGGRRRAELARARAARDEVAADYRQTVLAAFGEVEDQLVTLRQLGQEGASQRAAIDAAQRARIQAEWRYAGGYSDYYAVITAQNIELDARLQAAAIYGRHMNASVGLIKALGGDARPALD